MVFMASSYERHSLGCEPLNAESGVSITTKTIENIGRKRGHPMPTQ
jgi:hypothetical protein